MHFIYEKCIKIKFNSDYKKIKKVLSKKIAC